MSTDQPIRGRSTKTVLFEIDNWEEVGPVKVHVYTVPEEIGGSAEEVTPFFWLDGVPSFPVTLHGRHELPISIRAYRYPEPVSRVISKETGHIVEPKDKRTWPAIQQMQGSSLCEQRKRCVHEELGQEKCRPSVELVSGEITHNNDTWVLRVDGPPIEKSRLEAARAAEKKVRAVPKKKASKATTIITNPTKPLPHPADSQEA